MLFQQDQMLYGLGIDVIMELIQQCHSGLQLIYTVGINAQGN